MDILHYDGSKTGSKTFQNDADHELERKEQFKRLLTFQTLLPSSAVRLQ